MIDERNEFSTFYYRIQDGESGADVYDRVSTFFETMFRDFERDDFPENVVIVTHGMTLRLFLMRWFHWSPEEFENVRNPYNAQHFVLRKQKDDIYKLETELRYRNGATD
jgi:broad specificity phosphatase PhoE